MKNKLLLFFILSLLFHNLAQPQVPQGVTRSSIIEKYKDKPYYLHFVKAGETLLSISKAYGVKPEVILQENEEAGNGVYTDMLLKIPVATPVTKADETTNKSSVKADSVIQRNSGVNEKTTNLFKKENISAKTKAPGNSKPVVGNKIIKDISSTTKKSPALPIRKEETKKDIPHAGESRLISGAITDRQKEDLTVNGNDSTMSEGKIKSEVTTTDSIIIDRSLDEQQLRNKSEAKNSQKEKLVAENISTSKKSVKKADLQDEGDNSIIPNEKVTKNLIRKPAGVPSKRIVKEPSKSTVLTSNPENISQAQPKNNKIGRRGYIDYLVKSKETLYGISKTFNVSIDDILAANTGMGALKAGVKIKIPTIIYDQDAKEDIEEVRKDQLLSKGGNKISEPSKKSVETPIFRYEPYIVKDVKTVAALSKTTGLTKEELIAMNPELKNGIKSGQIIKLPVPAELKDSNEKIADSLNIVSGNEKKTKIDTPKKEAVNNPADRKESKSPQANVPVSKDTKDSENKNWFSKVKIFPNKNNPKSPTDTCNILKNNDIEYNIALLMPFYLENVDSTLLGDPENARESETYPQYNFIQYYAGTLLALDSLDKIGFKVKLHVYDVDHGIDSIKTLRLLSQPGFEKMDLIIGPIFANSFNIVAKYARKNEINIVNPLAKRNNIIVKNPFVYKVQPGDYSTALLLVNYILNNYQGANVILVRHDLQEQLSLVKEFITQARKAVLPFREIIYKTEGFKAISANLKSDKQNIVVLLSVNKVTVPDLTAKLNNAAKSTDITLFGIPGWENIQIEPEFLSNLKTHMISDAFIDYNDNSVKTFIASFREKFNTEPEMSKNAFLGFDITWYFLNALKSYGRDYGRCLPNLKMKGLQSTFDFKCKIPGNGYENRQVDIIKLDGYHWVKAGTEN